MAFIVRSAEIPTVSARINSSVSPSIMRRRKVKINVSRIDARDLCVKNQKSRLYGNFSAPVKEDCELSREEKANDKQSYYVNMGHAVRSIREEFPSLFYKEPNFDIYRFEDSRF